MTKQLKISDTLSLPVEIVTQKLAWLGVTGGGKTYGAQKLAELMWEAGAQFVVLDPVGVWFGLRLAADGKQPSDVTIPIFGGLHGDLPLEHTAGGLMADLIVDRGICAVLDVSQFESDAQKARFGADFADRFFFRKKGAPSAVHLFIEESQEFVPQNTMKGEERMLHAFTRLQKLGRNFGVGSSFITQRPQEVNKKALNMAQTLFVFRTTGPQERKAIDGWIAEKGLDQDIAGDLPKLKTGMCHVWSPEFLGVSETVTIREKRTFNASSTPEVGAVAKARHLAPIDLAKISVDMAATIERAKADDPKELRKKIAELERELKKKTPAMSTTSDRDIERIKAEARKERNAEWEKITRERETFIRDVQKKLARIARSIEKAHAAHEEIAIELGKEMPKLSRVPTMAPAPPSLPFVRERPPTTPRVAASPRPKAETNGDLGKGERAILTVLAQYPHGKNRRSLGTLAGYSASGGSFGTYISRLRGKGYVGGSDPLTITDAGIAALGDFEPLPRGEELAAYWLSRLGKGEAAILRVLLEAHPHPVTREELGLKTGYEASGGSFGTYLSRLRTKELLHPTELRASEAFFE